MSRWPKSRQLPVIFQALDLEGKTKPVPTLVCPVRRDVMTVGSCGRCHDFRRIEFTHDSRPVLCCGSVPQAGEAVERVQDVLRVPVVCAAPDTTLALIQPYLGGETSSDAIPVLDLAARPIGFVSIRDMQRLVRSGVPLQTAMSDVMSKLIVCVLPETSLAEARQLLAETDAAQLFAVAADGSFLGLLTRTDLSGRPSAARPEQSKHRPS